MPASSRSPRAPQRAEAAPRASVARSPWQRVGRAALLATAGLLPWFFLPLTAAPAASARFLLAALAATAGLVALAGDAVERRRVAYPGTLAGAGVLAVAIATAVSALLSSASDASLFGYLVMPDALAHVLVAGVLFVLAATFLTRPVDHVRLLAAFIGGAGLASLLGVLGLLGVPHLAALAPAFVSELGFVAVLALGLACLVPLAALSGRAKGALLTAALLALAVLALMNVPILWVALALVALFCAAVGLMRRTGAALPLALSAIALLFVLVGSQLPSLGTAEVRPSFGVSLRAAAHDLSARTALVGRGPGTFSYAFDAARPREANDSPFWSVRFLQGASFLATVPATLGILGVLAWLLLLAAAARLAIRRLDQPGVAFAALATTLAGLGLLAYPGSFVQLALGGIALGVLVALAGGRRETAFPARASWPLFGAFLGLIALVAGSLAGLYLIGQRYVAAAYLARGSAAIAAGNAERGLGDIMRAVALDGSDAHQRALSQALLARFREQLPGMTDPRAQEEALRAVIQAATGATRSNPADAATWSNLGGVYEGLTPYVEGMDAQALAAYDAAAARAPSSPAWPLARARTYRALAQFLSAREQPSDGPYAKAQEELARAIELKPDFVDARFLSAQLFFARGDEKSAMARIEELRDIAAGDQEIAFQTGLLLYQEGRYADAREDLARAVRLAPGYADARYFLGLAHAQLGERDEAAAQFETLRASNPDNAELPRILENLRAGKPVLDGIAGGDAATTTRP